MQKLVVGIFVSYTFYNRCLNAPSDVNAKQIDRVPSQCSRTRVIDVLMLQRQRLSTRRTSCSRSGQTTKS